MSVSVTSLKCTNCGAPLNPPGGALKRVICSFCNTENIIRGTERNLEILNKENIMGGLQFELNAPAIHKLIVSLLGKSECPPLDVFDQSIVRKVNKIVVPAYWFDNCTGQGTVQYDKAVEREYQEIVGRGDSMRTVDRTRKEWFPMSLAVSDTTDFIISGNKQYTDPLHMLYLSKQNPDIIDIELLEYPPNAIALRYDLPDAVAFNQYVKPIMEKTILAKAESLLSNVEKQNFQLIGTSIQKGEVRRISIGIYEVELDYKGNIYKLYFSNNGDNSVFDSLPVDFSRRDMLFQKSEAIRKFSSPLKTLFGGLAIAGMLIGLVMFLPQLKKDPNVINIILGILLIAGGIVAAVFYFRKRKEFIAQKRAMQAEYDGLQQQFEVAKQRFYANKIALKGVLKDLSGIPEAF